jgi:hypothetical protein
MADRPSIQLRRQEAYWVSVLLALLALFLAYGPIQFRSPVAAPQPVADSILSTTPVRLPSPVPEYRVGSFVYRCQECHRVPSGETAGRGFTKHEDVDLEHGINTRCLNCHHPVNREAFVDDFGEEIPWDQPPLLCAKCHGPVYRDWQRGSHGRINGVWDTSRGEQRRLKCIECHDPHRPSFQALPSAPGPRTLRVEPHHEPVEPKVHNPLRVVAGTDKPGQQVLRHSEATDQEHRP